MTAKPTRRRRSRTGRPGPAPQQPAPQLSRAEAAPLADDLIRELALHIGDGEAVAAVLHRWVDDLGGRRLPLVASVALQSMFTTCLVITPLDAIPPDSVVLSPQSTNPARSSP